MGKTVENILVGAAVLSIKQARDMLASWSRTTPHTGSYSAKLYKSGEGSPGSTHIELVPPTGITLQAWNDGLITNSFYCKNNAVSAFWEQFEFRFEDPNSDAWAEITAIMFATPATGAATWEKKTLAVDTPCGYLCRTELDTDESEWSSLIAANGMLTELTALDTDACAPEDWILTRVRVELWEATPERTALIDTVEIMGVTYAIEPGGDAPAISFGAPYIEVGYTEDGVTVTYTADTTPIKVAEETFPIGMVLSGEAYEIALSMAEATLANMNRAMAGSVLSGSILRLGGGVMKTLSLKIEGLNEAGYVRAIYLPKAVAIGAVGTKYIKDEKTLVPITLQALKPSATEDAVQIVDNVA